MENKKNTMHRVIVAIFALIGLAVSVVCFIWRIQNYVSIRPFILVGIYYAFVFYYGISGYKKPHGNMIRYLLLILAFYIASTIIVMVERWDIPWVMFAASNFAAVLIAYMAGRLNKMKKNIVIAVIISVLLLVKSFWPVSGMSLNGYSLFVLDTTMPIFMWITVALIYFFRYYEHREAGIEEDLEN